MSLAIERDWITAAGLRAICRFVNNSHRCGYVAVPKGHVLYGVGYSEPSRHLSPPINETMGKRGIIPLFCAAGDQERMRSPEIVFDVHGGITFSGNGANGYPAEGADLWWFGFDCAHSGDISGPEKYRARDPNAVLRSQAYVEAECESLARQLVERVKMIVDAI